MPLINSYALTNTDYTDAFQDEEGNILTLDTYEKLPTANIGAALRDYLLSIPRLKSFFKENIFYYYRQDNPVRTLPALNVYLLNEKNTSQFGWIEGKLEFSIGLPPSLKRDRVPDYSCRIANHLGLVLNTDAPLDFIRQYSPGLTSLSFGSNMDYDKAYKLERKKVDAYMVVGVANFSVNVVEYYESLWDKIKYEGSNIFVKPV